MCIRDRRRPTRGASPRRRRGVAWRPRSRRRPRRRVPAREPRGWTARTSSTSAEVPWRGAPRRIPHSLICTRRRRAAPYTFCSAPAAGRAASACGRRSSFSRVRVVTPRRRRAAQAAVAGCPACNQSRAARLPPIGSNAVQNELFVSQQKRRRLMIDAPANGVICALDLLLQNGRA